jgi:hypothetical protein
MFYSIDENRGGVDVSNVPVKAYLYRLAFSLLRLVIEHRKESRREAKPKPAVRPAHPIRPALQRLGRPRQ